MSKSLNVFHQPLDEEEEEKRRRELYAYLQNELDSKYNISIPQSIMEENIFNDIDTSNMNLRQELEAKFKALNHNQDDDNEILNFLNNFETLKTAPLSNNRNSTTIDDVYYSNDGKINTQNHEGGYNFGRKNDAGGPTNYGITQNALNEYNNWKSSYRHGFNFPGNVKDLSNEQAKQILDEMYFKRYAIDKLVNKDIARNVFDIVMSTTNNAPNFLADSINQIKGTHFKNQNIISDDLASFANKDLTDEEARRINDLLTQKGMNYYFNSVDKRPQNINNLKGWYNRRKHYYSNPEEFDELYKQLLEEYLKKYGVYYNGQ